MAISAKEVWPDTTVSTLVAAKEATREVTGVEPLVEVMVGDGLGAVHNGAAGGDDGGGGFVGVGGQIVADSGGQGTEVLVTAAAGLT